MDGSTRRAQEGQGGAIEPREKSELLTVGDAARLLNCSRRQVYRLADAGKLPAPVRLGALVRWPRKTIMEWISQGCPAVRAMSASGQTCRCGKEGKDHA
jgi:excisionase family DNA binding protein